MMSYFSRSKSGYWYLVNTIKLIALLPIATLFQGLSLFGAVNQILLFLIVLYSTIALFKLRIDKSVLLTLCLLIPMLLFDYSITSEQYGGINNLFYLLIWVFIIGLVYSQFDNICLFSNEVAPFFDKVVKIWSILVFISILLPTSFDDKGYFGSFPNNSFRTNSGAILILVLLIFCIQHNREGRGSYLLCSLVTLYCGFAGSSRTYFAVIVMYFIIFISYFFQSRASFRLCLVMTIAICVMSLGFTAVGKRFFSIEENAFYGFFDTLTSGRSIFWKADVEFFLSQPILNQIAGSGFSAIYSVNESAIGARIWAHNDFINILVSHGFAGIICYLTPLVNQMRLVYRICKLRWIYILILLSWLLNSNFNMVYTYICAAMSLALFPIALNASDE